MAKEQVLQKDNLDKGTDITKREVIQAIQLTRNNNPAGPVKISIVIIKLIEWDKIVILITS